MRYHGVMPRKDTEKMTDQILVRVPPSMTEAVDAWRREQHDLPTRAEALRRLAATALKAAGVPVRGEGKAEKKCRKQ
jgi:hypothetical protein